MEDVTAIIQPPSPPAPPPRKYVSVFRIDGVPILPPMMTSEKRRQMQKLKEKALKVEARLADKRHKRLQFCDNLESVLGASDEYESETDTPRSLHSTFDSDAKREEAELQMAQSYLMLSKLIGDSGNGQRGATVAVDAGQILNSLKYTGSSSSTLEEEATLRDCSSADKLVDRMQKLAKTDTIIYDNRANAIIMPVTDEWHLQEDSQAMQSQVPSIFVDPPTPVAYDLRTFCSDSHEGANVLDDDDGSADFEYYTNRSNCPATNIYAKDVSSDESYVVTSPRLQQPNSCESPISERRIKKLEPGMRGPLRSATSPQLKMLTVNSSLLHTLDGSLDSLPENQLVRSNSFTLACPSKVLLEHMRQQMTAAACGAQSLPRRGLSASATRDTVESKAKRVQKVEPKSSVRTASTRGTKKASGATNSTSYLNSVKGSSFGSSNSLAFKNKRSPYDSKNIVKSKSTRPVKKSAPNALTTPKQMRTKHSASRIGDAAPKTPSPPKHDYAKKLNTNSSPQEGLYTDMHMKHNQKLLELVTQQNEEQRRMQLSFELQKQRLLEQLSTEKSKVQLLESHYAANAANNLSSRGSVAGGSNSQETSPNSRSDCSSDHSHKSPLMNSADIILSQSAKTSLSSYRSTNNNNLDLKPLVGFNYLPSLASASTPASIRCTPRRRLFAPEDYRDALMPVGVPVETGMAVKEKGGGHTPSKGNRIAAVTVINAYARGFLVRRLFQTEQIQRIVQTIRDTLIFVLNLHMETLENAAEAHTPENIKLKARLLQQLSSATRTLHLVFFQTTVRERMEIITRDRKRIKTKLLSLSLKR